MTAAIHGLLGVVAASRDRPAEAQASFEHQLAIQPAADVDHELGPKIVDPFMAARTVLGDRAIVVRARPVNGGVDVGLTDPLAMIVSIRAVERSHGGAVIATASGTQARDVHLAIGRDAPRDLTVSVLDAYGNRLADVNVELREDDVATGSSVRMGQSRRWMLWAGAAVGFSATGFVFALLARSTQADLDEVIANSGEHTLGEAEALDRRGGRQTLIANLAFGAAGLFAAGAVIDYVWRRETKPVRVYPTASTAGLLLGVAGEF